MAYRERLENRAAHFLGQLPVVAAAVMEAAQISCVLIRCRHNMIESW